jgi:hypothetical protein
MMTRHLLYQICPLSFSDEWERNVRLLLPYMSHFNGKKVITIKTGSALVSPGIVEGLFSEFSDIQFLHIANDANMADSHGFIEAMKYLESLSSSEITFYAHTKGVSPKYLKEDLEPIREWYGRMYHYALSDIHHIDSILSTYACCGSFKRQKPFPNLTSPWHFSGTFFWFRHDHFFSRADWAIIPPKSTAYFVEGVLGRYLDSREAYCLYGVNCGDLYYYVDQDWARLDKSSQNKLPTSNQVNRFLYQLLRLPT